MKDTYLKIISVIVYIILIPTFIALMLGYIGYGLAFPIIFLGNCILLIKQAIISYKENKKGFSLLAIASAIFAMIAAIYWIVR